MPCYVDLDKKINVMLRTELCGDIGVCEMSIRQYLDNVGAELPAEDVRPVVRGRWEHLNWGFDYDRCSVCGYEHRWPGPFYFCPNCGADMREVGEDG